MRERYSIRQYFQDRKEYYAERGEEEIWDIVRDIPSAVEKGSNILDVGCGQSFDGDYLSKKGYDIWGIDRSPYALLYNIPEFFTGKFILGNALELHRYFEPSFFDAVICCSVLNHIPNYEKRILINEAFGVLKDSGIFFLSVPTPIKESNPYNTSMKISELTGDIDTLFGQCGFSKKKDVGGFDIRSGKKGDFLFYSAAYFKEDKLFNCMKQ